MKQFEMIPIYFRFEKGKTICVCHQTNKQCDRECEKDIVRRDKLNGWREVMRQDKYGR